MPAKEKARRKRPSSTAGAGTLDRFLKKRKVGGGDAVPSAPAAKFATVALNPS